MKQTQRHYSVALAMTALSHPRRVVLFELLEKANPSGLGFDDLLTRTKWNITTLRHHLRLMQNAKLVTRRRKGANIRFRLHGAAVRDIAEGIARRLDRISPPPRSEQAPPPLT